MQSMIDKAKLLLGQNRLNEARCLYEQLCTSKRDDIDHCLTLAIIYRRLRLFNEAAAVCSRILSLQPDNALAHHINGSIQQCHGDISAAVASYKTALEYDPSLAEAHYFLGNALQLTGQSEEAAENFRKAIHLQPDYIEALSNLGAVLMGLHQYKEARTVLLKALDLCPDCEQILCNLGDLSLVGNDPGQAQFYAESALIINPGFLDAHFLLGKISREQGDYDRALKHYRDALKFQPDNENIIGSIADILEIRGEFDESRGLLQPLIDRGSGNPIVLRVFSALSRNYNEEVRSVGLLEKTLVQGGLDLFKKIRLHSELGKQYDHLGDYTQAFEHYRQANVLEKILNKSIRLEHGGEFIKSDDINRWLVEYGADYWDQLPRSGVTSNRPIFIVGMPRSGTTLVEQILASHPDVFGAGELPDIADLVEQLPKQDISRHNPKYLSQLARGKLSSVANEYLAVLDGISGEEIRVVDKMPTNFWYLGIISLMFPNAYIIHLNRDPRDVCLSIYFQRFDASMTFTTDLQELAAYYSAYSCVMAYWKTVLDIKIMDIQYEELVADQERVIRRLARFCNLEWDERCLDFYKTDRDVNTPSYDQVRQPMYSKSVGRWKNYEQHLTPLIESLGIEI